ncbi:hypothetical protein SKAU_G00316200 [Synaphobranchus kaupii]|uniref:Uncharacterized protein n=1 Tax=Synaphobranchus kaupii TaxID=118154 RepID=A0A9Q1IKT2_SYNKA|nr:hypothetical protein SKAU_G00316200 [Synaphobranchus kaupii]
MDLQHQRCDMETSLYHARTTRGHISVSQVSPGKEAAFGRCSFGPTFSLSSSTLLLSRTTSWKGWSFIRAGLQLGHGLQVLGGQRRVRGSEREQAFILHEATPLMARPTVEATDSS